MNGIGKKLAAVIYAEYFAHALGAVARLVCTDKKRLMRIISDMPFRSECICNGARINDWASVTRWVVIAEEQIPQLHIAHALAVSILRFDNSRFDMVVFEQCD